MTGPLDRPLESYGSIGAQQRRTSLELRALLRAQPRVFERDHFPEHFTGSAWVTSSNGEWVLLNHHRKLDRWMQFGGHCDGDSDVAAVAVRETFEETGLSSIRLAHDDVGALVLQVERVEVPPLGVDPAHQHLDVRFWVVADRRASLRRSAESKALRWIRYAELSRWVEEPSLLALAERAHLFARSCDSSVSFVEHHAR